MIFERTLDILRQINRFVALLAGLLLALTVMLILTEITMRAFGRGLGVGYELSGYAMAIVASWGVSHALVERAHVRIDLLRQRVGSAGRALLDLLSIATLAVIALIVAMQCWRVLSRSISGGSTASTPLGTPMWIPQTLWFSGWVWFVLTSWIMLVCAIGLLATRRFDRFERGFGIAAEAEIPK